MKITTLNSVDGLDVNWNKLCKSAYQQKSFLKHLELYNYCNQKYYQGYQNKKLMVGCVVYSLKVNVLTFAKYALSLPMTIIGIPASVDASGIIGNPVYFKMILTEIMIREKGIILCLNYDNPLDLNKIINMTTLPTMILKSKAKVWETYLGGLRHNYRRRILKAQYKFNSVVNMKEPCSKFTESHYELYLNIMNKTKTKLEVLGFEFFNNLPSEYTLHSFYHENKLLTWHITTSCNRTYYFLFGGIDYSLRDKFDSYYNNLIEIINEAIQDECETINLGQTAEVSKNRLGAIPRPKYMFIYHRNHLVRTIFKLSKNVLEYKLKPKMVEAQKPQLIGVNRSIA